MPELTVAAGLADGLMTFAQGRGADRSALAAKAGIALADLEDQDNRVPFERYVALMRAAKAMTGDPALALHYGEMNDLAQISIVGLIGEASETMLEAMHQLNRFGRLVIEFDGGPDRFTTAVDHEGVWGVDTRQNPNAFPELTESTFARMICGPRRFGVTQLAKAVQVTHPDPGYGDEYERVFQAPVTFNAPRNAMLLDEKWIHHRLQAQPRYVFGIFSERAEALLQRLQASKTIRGRVEGLLLPILHTGEPRMDTVADRLGLSRPTLGRRLKAEGVTFEQVLDELRHRLAVDYLSGRKVSVNETAYLVGFSEPAAFSRAFKRWTGVSPSTIRLGAESNRATTA
ncbi:AraC-like DNA-binding protein [Caulobacter ginsengisoli]|uniref:AraC-like DNA-binding protein n=1 Tax=Caulobacter ginsengisoli TaxID=400775 RepID=A0ABU0IN21_9CAUL|nr:AraC family transcriptional regulator [Caulobacter ginsengisoli]MDQ0463418.1 AraC-like DNA-binding protein [Caulobacter ginsengisoli]